MDIGAILSIVLASVGVIVALIWHYNSINNRITDTSNNTRKEARDEINSVNGRLDAINQRLDTLITSKK